MGGGSLALLDDEIRGLDDGRAEAMIDFEPPVPPPAISSSLSPCTSLILSKGTPSCW
jgi:hypothetical protein